MSMPRPTFTGLPGKVGYGSQFALAVNLPAGVTAGQVSVSLMDLGFSTHSLLMSQRAPPSMQASLTSQAWSSSSALSQATARLSPSPVPRQLRSTRLALRGSSFSPTACRASVSGASAPAVFAADF